MIRNIMRSLMVTVVVLSVPKGWATELADAGVVQLLPQERAEGGAPAEEGRRSDLTPKTTLPRETQIENALGRTNNNGTAVGGYGELTFNTTTDGSSVVDLRRVVLFFGHDFNETWRFYSEVELEHAVSSASDKGEVEIEQAFVDGLFSRKFAVRAGLMIMPMGIVNVYHEPPSFNGVDRPDVDLRVIPSTWREPGLGIFGELAEGLRYQLYFVNGFNANGFTAESGVREGHQEAQLAFGGDWGAIGRLDYEPWLGVVFGASAYGGTSGNSLRQIGRVPVAMLDVDARYKRGGFTARAQLAASFIGDSHELSVALLTGSDDQRVAGPVSSQNRGGYVEAGYDVLRLLAPTSEQSFTLFTRVDAVDTQAAVPDGFEANKEYQRSSVMLGVVYRPIAQIALKVDARRHWLGTGHAYNELAAAVTWLF